MKSTFFASAAAVLLASGIAHAQGTEQKQPQAPSTQDSGSAQPGGDKTTPKTTGAMNNAVGGVATSPQDVGAQQQGKPTAAQGGGAASGDQKIEPNKGPKTTGAAPGADYRQ
ncbi:hypothetical protein [Hansschlegelia sp.]|uniref:hypothetical protein n=1 Tax=Hansschlegelia sp. TaxID=2041892 RepID=UPI002BFDF233|nr:hypothetical protein [Hansschlegelia sp.]HVI28883.1 hypothetical protein [Hansschlegelia sp.]